MLIDGLRLLGKLVEPAELFGVVILAWAVAARAGWGHVVLGSQFIAVGIVVLIGILPGGVWLAAPLETWFPANPVLPTEVAGIITLGGTERVALSETWQQPIFNDSAPIAALIELHRRYPKAAMVFTGGAASRYHPGFTESQVVQEFLKELGVDPGSIVYEERSRNTFENALFTHDLVRPKANETWILVTEAISMPRAVAVFRHVGWDVIPFPAGYLTDGRLNLSLDFNLLSGLNLAAIAVHEWGGLLAYRLFGYTDELLPRRTS